MKALEFAVDPAWRILFKDMGIEVEDVLRRAELPLDLFARGAVRLPAGEYYRLWSAIEAEVGDPLFPILLACSIRSEAFSPSMFAALCSPNLRVAIERLAAYKPLIAPLRLSLHEVEGGAMTDLKFEWLDVVNQPPQSYVAMELLFFVALARLATRERVMPTRVCTPTPPEPAAAYLEYLGVSIERGAEHAVRFTEEDMRRPFLTADDRMWQAFEPGLRKRLAELDESATVAERVKAALLEGLPSGRASMDAVSRQLSVSKRTLQRRLSSEGTTFQSVLQATRHALATHYLESTSLAAAEISFLLGFEEPNSFYRAFSDWTGSTPDSVRRAALAR